MSTTTHHMTAEEFIKLDDGYSHELVKGELLTMSPAGAEHGAVIMNLAVPLALHVKTNRLGIVFGAETGFTLERAPDTVLAPDIAFIRKEKMGTLSKGYREGPPDLAVEVISSGESKKKIETKTARWLQFGTLTVWLVNPQTKTVEVRPTTGEKKILSEQDVLTGEPLVPGFSIPVAEVFSQD
jgi:Uma2 family endonuclease